MQHFPVVCSTLSATHLGKFLQQQYHLGAGTTCRLLRAAINHAYLVTDGMHKYVFRVYSLNWRSGIEIAEEIRLLQLLKEHDIPVSYGIPDPQGNYMQQIPAPEGMRLGVLFSFAKGEKLINISEALHFKIGEIMARMHRVTQNLSLQRVQYDPKVLLIDSFELLKQYIAVDTEEMRFMRHAQQYLLQQYDNVQAYPFRNGIVHLDIWFDNLNIHNNEGRNLIRF
jgi:Ser/Thr protein kinase RdoA (MazF antagonist)